MAGIIDVGDEWAYKRTTLNQWMNYSRDTERLLDGYLAWKDEHIFSNEQAIRTILGRLSGHSQQKAMHGIRAKNGRALRAIMQNEKKKLAARVRRFERAKKLLYF